MATKTLNSGDATLPLPGIETKPTSGLLSTKAERQEFFLPVTGFAWFYPEERDVINHPAFQRLGRINQLGQAHLVFRGATHKRIEHVLGAVHIAQKMISAVNFNVEKSKAKNRPGLAAPLSDKEQRFIRLGALLHDIGHLAAGHTLEDELGLIGKHDADDRLDEIFGREWDSASARGRRPLQALINELYANCLPPKLGAEGATPTDIVRLLIRKRPLEGDRHARLQELLEQSEEIRFHACSNMIGNTICADLLDYIYRDWYHVGKPRQPDDRIFQYMEIRREGGGAPASEVEPHPDDRFVIALGAKTKIRTDGVSAILGLLEWRYELAETVLFHRTKVAAGAMLDRALFELWEGVDPTALLKKVLSLSDEELIDRAIDEVRPEAEGPKSKKAQEQAPRLSAALSLLQKLRDRDLYKELATFDATNLVGPRINVIKSKYSPHECSQSAQNRTAAARLLEQNFELPPGSIAVYCCQIPPKIAEVSIALDNLIRPFNVFEGEQKNRLTGGHLEAQVERFERLWRIHFFIDAEVKRNMPKDKYLLLQEFVDEVVLAVGEPDQLSHKVKEKALVYVHQEMARGNKKIEYLERPLTAAKADPMVGRVTEFPNGAPSMRLYVGEKT